MSAQPPENKICTSCMKAPATTWIVRGGKRNKRKFPICSPCFAHATASGFKKKK